MEMAPDETRWWIDKLESVGFVIQIDGEKVVCRVTEEALQQLWARPCPERLMLQAFDANRETVEQLARKVIAADQHVGTPTVRFEDVVAAS